MDTSPFVALNSGRDATNRAANMQAVLYKKNTGRPISILRTFQVRRPTLVLDLACLPHGVTL
jgi:hypothetical protein